MQLSFQRWNGLVSREALHKHWKALEAIYPILFGYIHLKTLRSLASRKDAKNAEETLFKV